MRTKFFSKRQIWFCLAFLVGSSLFLYSHLQAAKIEEMFEDGQELMANRSYQKALLHFQKFIEKDPQNKLTPKAYLYMGKAAYFSKNYDQSVDLYQKFLKKYPGSELANKAKFLMARSYMAKREYQKASKIYLQASSRLQAPPYLRELSQYYLDLAEEFYKGKKVTLPGPIKKTKIVRDYGRALRYFQLASQIYLKKDEKRAINHKIAFCHFHLNQYYPALQIWEKLLKKHPGAKLNHEIYYYLGQCYFKRGTYPKTQENLTKLIDQFGDSPWIPQAYQLLGQTHSPFSTSHRKDLDKGLSYWKIVPKRYPTHKIASQVSYDIGRACYNFGLYDKAITQWREFLEKYPKSKLASQALYSIGSCHETLKHYGEARAVWKEFLGQFQSDKLFSASLNKISQSFYTEGYNFFQSKKYREAEGAWNQYLLQYPLGGYVPTILQFLGSIKYLEKDFPEAIRRWRLVSSRYPGRNEGAQAQYSIAQTCFELKKLDQALEELTYLLRHFPYSSYANQARQVLREMNEKLMKVETKRVYTSKEKALLHISLRNIPELTFRIYKLDLKEYFWKKHVFSSIEDLLIEVVAPDKKFDLKVPGFQKYQLIDQAFDLTKKLSGPGAYIITVEGAEYKAKTLFLVSDIALISKHSPKQVLVFAQDEITGKPAPGVPLFLSDGGDIFTKGMTNKQGIFIQEFTQERRDVRVFAKKGNHYALSPAQVSSLTTFGYQTQGYIYTDRPVYRPGQKVNFKGIVRKVSGGVYQTPVKERVWVEVKNNRDIPIYEQYHTLNSFGSFSSQVELTEEPPLGQYTITVQYKEKGFGTHQFKGSFYVEEYKKPEYLVEIQTPSSNLLYGEKIQGQVKVKYYFGGPVKKAPLQYTLFKKGYGFDSTVHQKHAWFFENKKDGSDSSSYQYVQRGSGTTDDKGGFSFTLPTDSYSDHVYLLQVQVQDLNRRWVSGGRTFYVTSQGYYAIVQADKKVIRPGQKVRVDLLTVGADHSKLSRKGKVVVVKRIKKSYSEVVPDKYYGRGRKRTFFRYVEEEVSSTPIATDSEGKGSTEITLPSPGEYGLKYLGSDRQKNTVEGSAIVFVSGEAEDLKKEARVVAQKAVYHEGEMAEILINSPTPKTYGLITFEGEKVLDYYVRYLPKRSNLLRIPLTSRHAPNVTIGLAIAQGNKLYGAKDEIMVFQFLNITVKTKKKSYRPGEKVTYQIQTTDQRGKAVSAEVSLAVVDSAVFAIRPDETPAIKPHFYNQRRKNSVVTACSYQFKYLAKTVRIAAELLKERERRKYEGDYKKIAESLRDADKGRYSEERANLGMLKEASKKGYYGRRFRGKYPPAPESPKLDDASKDPKRFESESGEEKGAAGPASGKGSSAHGLAAVQVRKTFADTAFWNGHIQTDKTGKREVQFPMPHNLTTWRVTARGVSAASLVGEDQDSFVTTKPFLIRLETPRFITQKDKLTLSTIVHNRTGKEVRFESDLKATGANLEGPSKVSDTLKGHQEKRYDWKVEAPDRGTAEFVARAAAGKMGDGTVSYLSVHPHGLPYQTGVAGRLENTTLERVKVPEKSFLNKLEIRFTPTGQLGFWQAIRFLQQYPYGCAEQTVNRFLPALMARTALIKMGVDRRGLKKWLDGAVKKGLVRLYNSQNGDGGWGWWRTGSSNPTLSAYVYLALAEGWRASYRVYHPSLQRGQAYLTQSFYRVSPDDQALIIYALSRGYSFNSRLASYAYRYRSRLSSYGLALLAMAYQNNGWKSNSRALATQLASKAQQDGKGGVFWKGGRQYSWYDGNLETTAYALKALMEINPSSPLAPQAFQWIMAQKRGGCWGSTKATGAVIQALARWAEKQTLSISETSIVVRVNGKEKKTTFSKKDFLRGQAVVSIPAGWLKTGLNSLQIEREGSTELYYSGTLSGYIQGENFAPQGYFLRVNRRYIPYRSPHETSSAYQPGYSILKPEARPKALPPRTISQIQSGKKWTVVLDIYSRSPLEYIALEDSLPAGAEVDKGKESGMRDHMEVRDEKVAFFLTKLSRGHTQIRYTLVAIHPGKYHVMPTRIAPMYLPQISGTSAEASLEIQEGKVEVKDSGKKKITPDEIYYLTRKLFKEGKYKEALALVEKLLPLKLQTSIRVEVLQIAMLGHLHLNHAQKAVEAYERLYELDPAKAELTVKLTHQLAESYFKIGQYERALYFFQKVVRSSFERELTLASEYRSLGRPLSAQTFTAKVLGRFPNEEYLIRAWYNYAIQFLTLKKKGEDKYKHFREESLESPYMLEEGFQNLKEFTSLYPIHDLADDAHYQCILSRYNQKRYKGTSVEAAFFIHRYSKSSYLDDVYYYKMESHFHRGDYKKALEAGEILTTRKFKEDPNSDSDPEYSSYRPGAFYLLGKIYHTQGDLKKAVFYYHKIMNQYEDARLAYQFFTRKELYLKDYGIFGLQEPARISLKYKNLKKADFKVYKVDLMMLFSLKGSLQNFHQIDLTGIKPQKKWSMDLENFDDYRLHKQDIEIPLKDKGTYLLVARVGKFDKTVILIKSKIRLSVQSEDGKVTVYATDYKTQKPLERVYIKVSVGGSFVGSGFTDSRGVFSASSYSQDNISVLAEKDGHYGLYRSK